MGTMTPARPAAAGKEAPVVKEAPVAAAHRNGANPAETIEQCVIRSLDQYFFNLNGAKPHALHEMVLGAVERPLLQYAMHKAAGNQSAAAELLGINRNTLRKKLQDYQLS